jgi:hypothetical protein
MSGMGRPSTPEVATAQVGVRPWGDEVVDVVEAIDAVVVVDPAVCAKSSSFESHDAAPVASTTTAINARLRT